MPGAVAAPSTLYDKVLRDHIVDEKDDGTILIYIGKPLRGRYILQRSNGVFQIAISCTKSHLPYVDRISAIALPVLISSV